MLIDKILAQIAPHECLGCFAEGDLLCQDCVKYLLPAPTGCFYCRRPTPAGRTCLACLPYSNLYSVQAATKYQAIAKDLIWHLKFNGTQAAAREMAARLAPLIPISVDTTIVPVPTATSRIRQRGYDQANLMARELAKQTHVIYAPALRRSGQTRQRGSNRDQRTSQLQDAYRVVRSSAIVGKHVVLIDDVLTTGSTLEAAANVLKSAGAKRVSGFVFARA